MRQEHEREIDSLASIIIETQMKKLEQKIEFARKIWTTFEIEKKALNILKQDVYAERI